MTSVRSENNCILSIQCRVNRALILTSTFLCFSSEVSQPGRRGCWRPSRSSTAWGEPRGGEDQADERSQRVRGGEAHPPRLSRRPDQTENFTGPSFVRPVPGGGRHDHHQLRLAPGGLPAGVQTEGEPSQHWSNLSRPGTRDLSEAVLPPLTAPVSVLLYYIRLPYHLSTIF